MIFYCPQQYVVIQYLIHQTSKIVQRYKVNESEDGEDVCTNGSNG